MDKLHDIPVIDLDHIDAESTLASLNHAARHYGTFYITCKQVCDASELALDVFDESKRFFQQPLADKMHLRPYKDGLLQGYMTSKRFAFDPSRKCTNDVRQFFIVPPALPRPAGAQEYSIATAPRIFPNPDFESATTAFQAMCVDLHTRLLAALARCLGIDAAVLLDLCSQKTSFLVANYYAASAPSDNTLGLSAHKDASLLTILCPERTEGLEIQVDGQWVPVPARPNTFICNIGCAMQKLTNDEFTAILHRVVNTGDERQSVGSFMHADFDAVLQLPGRPSSYPPELSGEHFVNFFRDAIPSNQHTYGHLISWEATLVQAREAAAAKGYAPSMSSLSSRCSQLAVGGTLTGTSRTRMPVVE